LIRLNEEVVRYLLKQLVDSWEKVEKYLTFYEREETLSDEELKDLQNPRDVQQKVKEMVNGLLKSWIDAQHSKEEQEKMRKFLK